MIHYIYANKENSEYREVTGKGTSFDSIWSEESG